MSADFPSESASASSSSSSSAAAAPRFPPPPLTIPGRRLRFSAIVEEEGILADFPAKFFAMAETLWEDEPRLDVPKLGFEIESGADRLEIQPPEANQNAEHMTDAFLRALKKTPLVSSAPVQPAGPPVRRPAGPPAMPPARLPPLHPAPPPVAPLSFHPTAEPARFAADLRQGLEQSYKMEYVSDPYPLPARRCSPKLKAGLLRIAALSAGGGRAREYRAEVAYGSEPGGRLSFETVEFRHTPMPFGLTFQVTVGVNTEKLLSDSPAVRRSVVDCFTGEATPRDRICGLLSAAVAAEQALVGLVASLRTNLYSPYGLRLSLLLYLVQLDCHVNRLGHVIPKDWLRMNFKGGSSLRACGMKNQLYFFHGLGDAERNAAERAARRAVRPFFGEESRRFRLSLVGLPGQNFDTLFYRGGGIENFIFANSLYTVVEARKSISPIARAVEAVARHGTTGDLDAILQKIM